MLGFGPLAAGPLGWSPSTGVTSSGEFVLSGGSTYVASTYTAPYQPVPMRFHLACTCCTLYTCDFSDNKNIVEWQQNSGSWNFNHVPNQTFPWITDHWLAGLGEIQCLQEVGCRPNFIVSAQCNFSSSGDEYSFKIGDSTLTLTYSDSGPLPADKTITVNLEGKRTFLYWYQLWNNQVFYTNTWQIGSGWQDVSVYVWSEDDDPSTRSVAVVVGEAEFRFDETIANTGDAICLGASGTGGFRDFALSVADDALCVEAPKCSNCLNGCVGYSVFATVSGVTNGTDCTFCHCQFSDPYGQPRVFQLGAGASSYPYDAHCSWRGTLDGWDWCYDHINDGFLSTSFVIDWDEDDQTYYGRLKIADVVWRTDMGDEKPDCTALDLSSFQVEEAGTVCDGSGASVHLWSEPTTQADPAERVYTICDCQHGTAPDQIEVTISGIWGSKETISPSWGIDSNINGTYVCDLDGIFTEYVGYVYGITDAGAGIIVAIYFSGAVHVWVTPQHGSYAAFHNLTNVCPMDCSNLNISLDGLPDQYPHTSYMTGWEGATATITNV